MGCGASTSSGKQPHHTMHVGGSQPKAASRANSFNTVSRRASTGPDNRKAVVGQRADRTANRALGTNIIKTLSATELRTMTPDQVDLLFRHVDLDGNGRLSRAELRQLCAVMVARISELMKEYMVSRMPHASPEQIERAVAEERAFLLPRAHSVDGGQGNSSRMTEEDWTKHMLAHLLAKLDVNDDGVVSKFEFSDTWNKVAASVFNIEGGHGSNDRNGCAQQ